VSYTVQIAEDVIRQINALPAGERVKIQRRIDSLEDNPRPSGCKKLQGGGGTMRVRQGNYRILYAVDDVSQSVRITKVGDRKNVYE
jgi:mRNA interferase RelE/StbE